MTLPLACDPVLPHRDALLDAEFVASCLAPHVEWADRITRGERVRATYRIGTSLRILHRFEANGQIYNVAARAFRHGRSEPAYEKALAQESRAAGAAPGVVHGPDVDAVFWLFPNDRRVAAFRMHEGAREALSPSLPQPWTHSRLVAWAPENAATFACLGADGAVLAYAKVGPCARTENERYRTLADALRSTGAPLLVPRVIAFSSEHETLLIEAIAGRRLEYGPSDMRAMGAALAHLHALPLSNLPRFERFTPSSRREAADVIARALPALTPAVERLDAALTRREPVHDDPGCLHGDVHPKNAVVNGPTLALIDVEEIARGHRAADLGSLLARLICARILGSETPAAAQSGSDALLDGYAGVGGVPDDAALRWHTAAALLVERTQRAVTRLSEPALRRAGVMIAEATRLLGSAQGLP